MILTRDVVEKLERDEEGTAMDGSPTHANSLWLDLCYPPSTTPAKEERVAIIHHVPQSLCPREILCRTRSGKYRGERPLSGRNINLSQEQRRQNRSVCMSHNGLLYSEQSPHRANGVSFLWQIMPSTTIPIRPWVTRPL